MPTVIDEILGRVKPMPELEDDTDGINDIRSTPDQNRRGRGRPMGSKNRTTTQNVPVATAFSRAYVPGWNRYVDNYPELKPKELVDIGGRVRRMNMSSTSEGDQSAIYADYYEHDNPGSTVPPRLFIISVTGRRKDYLHAYLHYLMSDKTIPKPNNNEFGVPDRSAGQVEKVINDALAI